MNKKYLIVLITIACVSMGLAAPIRIGLKDMLNSQGQFKYLWMESGNKLTESDLTSGSDATALKILNNLSDLNNAPTARTNLGLGGLATQNSISLVSATSTTGITANQVPFGSSSGQLNSESGFTYNPDTNTLTVPNLVATNATVTSTFESGSHHTTTGTYSVTTGINQNQTYTVQGTGAFRIIGSGSANIGTDLGTILGTVTAGSNIARLVFIDAVGTSGNYTNPVKVAEGTISANSLGINGYVKVELFASFPSNSSTKSLSLRIGETLIYGTQTSTTGNLCRLIYEVQNTGVTGTQTGTHPTHNNGFITSAFGSQTYNFNTTATQTVKLYMQTTGTETMKLHWFRLWTTTIN